MKIIRDGKEIELTHHEMMQAHREYQRECLIEDIKSKAEQDENYCITEDNIERIADRAERALDRNDNLWEDYWYTIQYVLGEERQA